MDTEKCGALVAVLEAGNIRGAASALGYTPSGVSRMMAALEAELGVTLLARSKKGVEATQACKELLPLIRRVAAAGDALEQAAGAQLGLESGVLRVGTAYPQYYGTLSRALGEFHQLHPGIQISLVEANSTPLMEKLAACELDFAVVSRREGDFDWHQLVEDELMAIVPADHALAAKKTYPMARFAQDPYIEIGPGESTDNARVLAQLGIEPNICYSVSTDDAGYRLVDAGLGVTLTNCIHVKGVPGSVVALPTRPKTVVSIGIATPPEAVATPAAKAFAGFAIPLFA